MLAVTLLAAASVPVSAQYRIDSWTTEQGLPQNIITDITQDRDGFLWLSTFGGLVRFDGATFEVFDTVRTPGLRSTRFTSLLASPDGAIWALTEGHGVTRYLNGAFRTFTTADGLPHNRVTDAWFDGGARLVVHTDAGSARWNGTEFTPRAAAPASGAAVVVLDRVDEHVMWYRDAAGVHKAVDGAVTRSVPRRYDPVRAFEDRQGRLWLETQQRRLGMIGPAGVRLFTTRDGVPTFATATFTQDREGVIWFGLRGGGLLRFDGTRFTRYSIADGLPSDSVGEVFQDREGTLWVATDGGLARFTARPMTAHSAADGLAADNTYPIFEDDDGIIWIGGWRGLTQYRDGAFNRVDARYGLADEAIMSIAQSADRAIWIGTWGGGVRRIADGRTSTFSKPRVGPLGGARELDPADRLPGPVVRAILPTRSGDIWFGGASGLSRFRDGVFTAADGYRGGEVQAIFEDRKGAVWIGSDTGLTRYEGGAFTAFGESDGLVGAPVRAFHEDADGSLWIGTYDGGLYRRRDGRLTRFTTREGLFTNGAFRIIEDAQHRFWITSNSGIYRVAKADLDAVGDGRASQVNAVSYGRRDGMPTAECNGGGQPAGVLSRDGRIWFPTQGGVVSFDPAAVPVDRTPPPVVITRMIVGDREIPLAPRVEIRSGPRALEVHFAALTLIRPEQSRFRYRLAGLDEAWTDARATSARFAQLPYGRFAFQVIAANRDGVWNHEGVTLQIDIVPPFWRTQGFAALILIAAAAAGFGAHRARIGHLRQRQALHETFARQLIDGQERDRTRIAGGLHDGLSQSLLVIRNWAVLGQAELPEGHAAAARLGEIGSTAAHALGEVREVVNDLAPYNLERIGLAATIDEMLERIGEASGIRFKRRLPDADARLAAPARIAIYRVVQEATNNIVKHSGATRAWVEMDVDDGQLRIMVRDDGRGFVMNTSEGRGGFGVLGMSERMRMVGGHLTIQSTPGQGTTVTIDQSLGSEVAP